MNGKNFFLFLFFFSFLLFSQIVSSQGISPIRISDVSYYPKIPKVFDDMNVTVEVENNFDREENLKLVTLVLKEGTVMSSSENNFFLDINKRKTVPFSHTTEDIGEHQMIFKLYRINGNEELDSKIINFTSISDLGPFDISIASLPDNIQPGMKIPLILRTTNNGQQGTDIDIKITIRCSKQPNIENQFVFYLDGKNSDQRVVAVPTCEKEEGLHSALAEMKFYNKTLLSSITQFYLSKNPLEILIDSYQMLTVTSGQPKSFDVSVMNPNNLTLDNLRLIIADIPSSWYEVKPAFIKQLQPNETAVFIVNLQAPESTKSTSYPISLYAASSQALGKAPLELRISNTGNLAKPSSFPTTILIVFAGIGIGIVGAWYWFKRRRKEDVFLDYELSG